MRELYESLRPKEARILHWSAAAAAVALWFSIAWRDAWVLLLVPIIGTRSKTQASRQAIENQSAAAAAAALQCNMRASFGRRLSYSSLMVSCRGGRWRRSRSH